MIIRDTLSLSCLACVKRSHCFFTIRMIFCKIHQILENC